MERIGIQTSGGDAAGLNPAIKWVVKRLMEDFDYQVNQVIGIKDGCRGLEKGDPTLITNSFEEFRDNDEVSFVYLNPMMVREWDRFGGTNLGTSRTNPYSDLVKNGRIVLSREARVKNMLGNISRLGLDGLIAAGGDDTQEVNLNLFRDGVPVVGVPKTIDKDVMGTDYTLGFRTAVEYIKSEIDRIRPTASSHKRLFILEVMGRDAGHLALHGGLSGGAYIILIPEVDFDVNRVVSLLEDYRKQKAGYAIMVVSEAAKKKGGKVITRVNDGRDEFGNVTLGGIASYLASELRGKVGYSIRYNVLGHSQRGGTPDSYDREMGRKFGLAAANLIVRNETGRMVALQSDKITSVPLEDAVGGLNLVNVDKDYDEERYNGSRNLI